MGKGSGEGEGWEDRRTEGMEGVEERMGRMGEAGECGWCGVYGDGRARGGGVTKGGARRGELGRAMCKGGGGFSLTCTSETP